ncbi:FRG domain-containing protein [Viridibacillus sp. NPDC096237]|uniref:FRG domain-containing protein n=1 Tax=Viridibacillus sp. NPDC096237 TaxID=3390721 RepID=UPI003D038C47
MYESNLYGSIKEPEDIFELLEMIIGKSHGTDHSIKVWRGQANADWRIDSGAYRRLLEKKSEVREFDLISYEISLLNRARHKGYGIDNGILLSDMELLARLQHHGAATRLVDFSKNSLIALWFCVNTVTEEYGLLFGVDTDYVGGMEGILGDNFKAYSSATTKLDKHNYPMLIEPPVVSKRIASQHGVFLYSDISDKQTGSLKIPDTEENIFIAISPKLKKQSRKVLTESFDLRKETLFPDLDGFSAANSFREHPTEAFRW